jgi:hypothetical protein
VTTATIEVHVMDEDGDDTGNILAKLHVMALPPRTVPVGIYRIGDDRLRDNGQPRMLPPTTPTNNDIKNELNDLFAQAGISFTISSDSKSIPNLPFDDDGSGEVDSWEIATIDQAAAGFDAPLRLVLAEKYGLTSNGDPFPRGIGLETPRACLVFVHDSGIYAATIAGHEIGHLLNLSFYSHDDAKHDPGPFPAGTEGLMQPGSGSNHPGRWLGHDDWRTANETAKVTLQ